ncbi:MAG: antibiotic biosynthesis monooxygenase [Hyphomicrobiales bacterium]|nr:antibiotic biosynthesis monooxygenase [Hyphomicrobiales bacterium]
MLHLISTMTIRTGSADALLAAARTVIAETRKEPGNISYDLLHSTTQPDIFVFLERWRDRAALDAHLQADHFKAWRKAGENVVLSRKIEIISDAKIETL